VMAGHPPGVMQSLVSSSPLSPMPSSLPSSPLSSLPGVVDNADKKSSPKKSKDAVVVAVTDRAVELVVGVVVVAVRL